MQSILFITTANLTTNPRLVKELHLAIQHGFVVKVLACNIGGWSQLLDASVVKEQSAIDIDYAPVKREHQFLYWLFSNLLQKLCKLLYQFGVKKNLLINAFAFERRTILLHWCVKKYKANKFSWVIAHNPGAFYPAYKFARKNNLRLGVDIEDYHPGEKMVTARAKQVSYIIQSILHTATYTSYAAPLIKEKVITNFTTGKSNIVINNVFSKLDFKVPSNNNQEILKLVWFSQYIDYGRGLEQILLQLDKITIPFTVTLIGNCRSNFFDAELKHRTYVHLLDPLLPKVLNHQLSNYHIGLAVEDASTDDNRDICLTNKIWSYLQAGLYVIATPTKAQVKLAEEYYEQILLLFPSDNLQVLLNQISNNMLLSKRIQFYNNAQHYTNWEQESNVLKTIWNSPVLISSKSVN